MTRVALLQTLQAKFLVTLPPCIRVGFLREVVLAKIELAGVFA